MWSYEIRSEVTHVPVMDGIGEPYVQAPTEPGGVFHLNFGAPFEPFELKRYEAAVGVRCHVRRTQDGTSQTCGGAVLSVEPLRVALDGEGWS